MEHAGPEASERFEALFDRYHGEVAAYVRRRAPARLAEDVVSETFLIAWRSLDRVHGDPLPWLYGVARRVLANDLRREHRRSALAARLAQEPDDPPTTVLGLDVSEPVRTALLALGHREREAVLLIAWEGLNPKQAAAAAGCSGATFRARLYRARRHLRRALSPRTLADEQCGLAKEAGGS
ncbi:MAG TPA: RNA polymerase sigma factor [Solirubrobacteraceae bacterium]|jgi:RNA polymerase sigma-70 factor (ECF subfamily)